MTTTLRTLAALLALSTAALAQDGGKLSWKGMDNPKAAMADAKRAGQTMMLFFSSVG